KNVIQCKNPRCITSIEEAVDHIFLLGGDKKYRCAYCEQEFHPGPSR
ncbi:MAG: aspartate carbamoyltransferase regulatory subunit, partial [Hydrogeniiclostridium mannosilyticum]